MPEQPAFSLPTHPLDILASTMDLMLLNPMNAMKWTPPLSTLAAACRGLSGEDLRTSLSCLAAHIAVRNQVMLLGQHEVDEETQTAALFGFLANALSMVTLLAAGYTTSLTQKIPIPGCYWAHQKKLTEEPYTGADFGIITDVGDGKVKLTLFQAKRPQQNQRFEDLRMTQIVHSDKPIPSEDNVSAWQQMKRLQEIKTFLAQGNNINTIEDTSFYDGNFWDYVINHGPSSLFVKDYKYEQSTAFLATELIGWLQSRQGSWCYYAQWSYGKLECPWAISVIAALELNNGYNAISRSLPFVNVLAQALSPKETDIGLIIPFDDVKYWASTISSLMPGIQWGSSAESAEGAANLINAISITQREIQQIDMQQSTTLAEDRNMQSGPKI